jgi:hypothetical protein
MVDTIANVANETVGFLTGQGGGGETGQETTGYTTQPSGVSFDNPIFVDFMRAIRAGGVTNPYALAAIAATGSHESGFSARNAAGSWDDPSETGRPGIAGGIMSWNNERYENMKAFVGDNPSASAQAAYFLQEDPQLITALNNAKSVDEAIKLMNNAWRFAGYDRPGGEAAARAATAAALLPLFSVTSLSLD